MTQSTFYFEEAEILQKNGYTIVCFSYFVDSDKMLITLEKLQ